MRFSSSLVFTAFVLTITAIPITPSARSLQHRAEQFRLAGLKEYEIAEKLTHPTTLPSTLTSSASPPLPLLSRLNTALHALLYSDCAEEEVENDVSGDIAPGSLEAPQMLPRPAALVKASGLGRLIMFFRGGEDADNFGYEGKELELRRPTGMRHWGVQDKWRLF